MRWMYVAIVAVLALVTLIFALQNLQSVTVSFLRLQLSSPLAVLIIIVYALGMATGGWLAGVIYDHVAYYEPAFATAVLFNVFNLVVIGSLVLRGRSLRMAAPVG